MAINQADGERALTSQPRSFQGAFIYIGYLVICLFNGRWRSSSRELAEQLAVRVKRLRYLEYRSTLTLHRED